MARARSSVVEQLSASATVRLNVTFQDRPYIAFFEASSATVSVAEIGADRFVVSLRQMPQMPPLRLEENAVVWGERQLLASDDAGQQAEAERFVRTVNDGAAPGGPMASKLRFSPSGPDASLGGAQAYDGQHDQFAVINIGSFRAVDRLQRALGLAASEGWDLVAIYDKASNWLQGMEKGFILLKPPVPAGQRLRDEEWCISRTTWRNVAISGPSEHPPAYADPLHRREPPSKASESGRTVSLDCGPCGTRDPLDRQPGTQPKADRWSGSG